LDEQIGAKFTGLGEIELPASIFVQPRKRLGWFQWKSTLETKVFAPCSVGKSFPKPFWGILAVWRISKFFKKENLHTGDMKQQKGQQ